MSLVSQLQRVDAQTASAAQTPAAFNAFVHVAYGYDARKWRENWRAGKVPGLNEEFPYGYHRAAQYGAHVAYATDHPESKPTKFLRYGLRAILGFDFLHAWRNREEIFRSHVVWTHTESQSLAILALFAVSKRARPKLIGQAVWLIDEWRRLNPLRKWLFKKLLAKADILSFLSPLNAARAAKLFPNTRIEFLKFGINPDYPTLPRTKPEGRKIRVLSAGNDRHRDWATLIEAADKATDIELRILSGTYKPRGAHANITVLKVDNNRDLFAQFEWADMIMLPLKPNFHASGITVLEEAAILGVPAISTKAGGLEAYFPQGDVLYVEPGNAGQIRDTVRKLAADPELREALVANSKRRLTAAGLTSSDYARRHVELTRELLAPGS